LLSNCCQTPILLSNFAAPETGKFLEFPDLVSDATDSRSRARGGSSAHSPLSHPLSKCDSPSVCGTSGKVLVHPFNQRCAPRFERAESGASSPVPRDRQPISLPPAITDLSGAPLFVQLKRG
jgi:hypothetical protein